MGTVSREELMKWEKMRETVGTANAREEKIMVLVRLRPLSEKEIEVNEVADWECINGNTILYRNTLREGSTFPNAYTFDRVFRGDCSTKQVYEEGAREIALSVVSGINSSIFAYGQTSSGKTYTMNGILEYSVADIFDYIQRHEERAFVLKFSAIEIYNEAVRDLLSTDNSTTLRLLDDPERGIIVEKVTEETLRDWNHLEELISICEAQRRIGETSLNEKSSRSHQIIRLTIESSAREFLGKDNSTTLAASVNFVDLAGSERASQAISAGARLKEGCHINRSLLTLSTVIRKLSKGRNGHINYRDSKLTRLLQPCLGGNARTAVICTLSPARSHVEQTRNTLLFACCAKEVTTKAQVNVVMSDKALVKHLQKELARLESELRTPVPVSSNSDYAALLRKKDLQIEKMGKEIRELTKQRDLAQSRVEDLLRMIGNDQDSREECSASESSIISNSHRTHAWTPENTKNHLLSNGTSSLLSNRMNLVNADDSDDCREVQCIATESSRDNNSQSLAFSTVENGDMFDHEVMSAPSNGNREVGQMQNGSTTSVELEERLHSVQMPIDSLVSPFPDDMGEDTPNVKSMKLTRSSSCRANAMTVSSSPDRRDSTPPYEFETGFPGRPDNFPTKFHPLNYGPRLDSQSSIGSAHSSIRTSAEEDITSLDTFVAGMKEMAKLEYKNQLFDGQVQGAGARTDDTFSRNMKNVGLHPMQEVLETPSDWPQVFEKQQRMILGLWQTCNVSLVHRTYFFLLFKGDTSDAIYMEVELRRLTFLKETFSHGNQAVEGGRTLTLASSTRALRREREMLTRLMQRRFSEQERKRLFEKWGISLNSKRRRLQLANCLWSNVEDMNHAKESAAIVASLVRFVEQGQALKGMFGLSFTPPQAMRRSYIWKNSAASLF